MPDDDPAAKLESLIHAMARYVIRSERLPKYFRGACAIESEYHPGRGDHLVLRTPEVPSGVLSRYQKWRSHLDPPAEPVEYEGADMPLDYAPRFPAVPLLRVHLATFSGSVRAERKLVAPPDYTVVQVSQAIFNTRASGTPLPSSLTDSFTCRVSLYIDIHLVIGPRRWIGTEGLRDHDLAPMFQTQWYGELNTDSCNYALACPRDLFPEEFDIDVVQIRKGIRSVAARFDDGWRRITDISLEKCAVNSDFPEILIGLNQVWHDFVKFERVHSATVRAVMEFLSQPSLLGPSNASWLCPLIGPHAKPSEFRYEARRCREFETALYTGAIEKALVEDCRDLDARLKKRIEDRKAALDSQDELMLARWRETDSGGDSRAE
jgi:hypothetical protein